jgi:Zn-finger nucleic acid-binding protein
MFRGRHAGTEVDICSGCQGVWLDRSELAAITGKPVDLPDSLPGTDTAFACPRCSSPLRERSYAGRSDLLIECCSGCGGIFLDRGELLMIKDLAKSGS